MEFSFNKNRRFICSDLSPESAGINETIFSIDQFINASAGFSRNASETFLFRQKENIIIGRSVVGIDELQNPFFIHDTSSVKYKEFKIPSALSEEFFTTNLWDLFTKLENELKFNGQNSCLILEFPLKDQYISPKLRLIAFENH